MPPMSTPVTRWLVGVDVGSTAVKTVVVDAASDAIVWSAYQRHESRQATLTLDLLRRAGSELGLSASDTRVFVTGSGGGPLAPYIGARFVQEVTALTLAVERLHPEVNSVVELGGQDAKIIVFQDDPASGRRKKIPSMNDKCAGGTGAVIDKIAAKLHVAPRDVAAHGYRGLTLHKVAGKCGVFAETDINGLQKHGVPVAEVMASLFEAIVLQNLTVLTRGHTLRPHVLLLGGPNTFIRGMREAWQAHIPRMWVERGVAVPPGETAETVIKVPAHAQYFAAIGAIEFGRTEDDSVGRYLGWAALERYVRAGTSAQRPRSSGPGLSASADELAEFRAQYTPKVFVPPVFEAGTTVRGFVGLDAGSTSTKAVLLSEHGDVLCKVYRLSLGHPIEDAIEIFRGIREQVECRGARIEVLGVATTGYAKDLLKGVLQADVALVETVAHAESAIRHLRDPHVIVDVGGQDIKLMFLRDGRVKDFRLNTQCSAGNGYFLQATADAFGVPLPEYAEQAFAARTMPTFNFGCAVFLQSDIVDFQRQGWGPGEILAGLAAVLPKNVFLYVAGVPNLATLGSRFVLQGGTQRNLAVVKAEVDFIRSSFHGAGRPEIIVHEHCGEAGAIGAALEARRLYLAGHRTTFVGLDAVATIRYRTTCGEETRCTFCRNQCLRTFIDIADTGSAAGASSASSGDRRVIVASCEKGAAGDVRDLRAITSGLDAVRKANPNFVAAAATEAWRPRQVPTVADPVPDRPWRRKVRSRAEVIRRRPSIRIGVPRVLNMYVYAPFFSAYFESLGVDPRHLVYSDVTTPEMYREGTTRGAIDPCFPAKIALAHVHNLLLVKHLRQRLDYIFFPMFETLHTSLTHLQGTYACPTVTITPDTVKAAFTKETDLFAAAGIRYLAPMLNLTDRALIAHQLLQTWGGPLGLSADENERALDLAFGELAAYERDLRRRARTVLDGLERERRVGIVLLGRSYHHDPGVNHQVLDQFQQLGYPVFSQHLLPEDGDLLDRLFGEEVRAGSIPGPLAITDVWKNSYSAGTNEKLWAAKFAARHPNLVALEISSFKCGHDAPIYGAVEAIVERSGTPYFSLKDLDENKPAASLRVRVETIHYFLKRYETDLQRREQDLDRLVDAQLAAFERQLRSQLIEPPGHGSARASGAVAGGLRPSRPEA